VTNSPTSFSSVVASNGVPYSTNSTAYFPTGWVQSRTGPDGQTTTYDYWPDGQVKTVTDPLTNVTHYFYDTAGRQSLIGDALSHTNQFGGTTTSYVYNDTGIRVSSTTGGTTRLYLIDPNNHTGYAQILEELNTVGGAPTRSYVIGDDVLGQCDTVTTAPLYMLQDGHGSTRQMANTSGAVTSRYNYDAYGTEIVGTSSSTAQTSLLYCGQQFDSTLNMYNLRARFYDPSNGRFNARDTFMGSNDDPQSLHKYAYGADNPVNNIDPSGNEFISEVLDIGNMLGQLDSFVNNAQLVVKKAMSVAYRQRAFNLLTTVIRPTLNAIQDESGTKLGGENAEYMLLGTCIAETGDLDTRRQKGNGPARGLFQMEPFTHDDLWKNYLSFRPKLRDAVLKHFNITPPPNAQLLESNDAYAAIMARIRYLPARDPIPSATDLNGQALYWVKNYNRGGKGTVAEYLSRWHAAMGL
jgi:RHS repeat-associated protein